jgi:hypothetical protein
MIMELVNVLLILESIWKGRDYYWVNAVTPMSFKESLRGEGSVSTDAEIGVTMLMPRGAEEARNRFSPRAPLTSSVSDFSLQTEGIHSVVSQAT